MSVIVKTGVVAKRTSGTGLQAITGLGGTPRALIVAVGGALAADLDVQLWRQSLGFAARDSSNAVTQTCYANANLDNQATTDVKRFYRSGLIALFNVAGTLQAEAELDSFDSDGFTLDWTTNDVRADLVHWWAVMGSELTNAKVHLHDGPAVTGPVAYSGLGIAPTAAFFMHARFAAATAPASTDTAVIGFGAAAGSGQMSLYEVSSDAQAVSSVTRKSLRNDSVIHTVNSSTGAADDTVSLDSFDADGFTLGWDAVTTASLTFAALLIEGGAWAVGTRAKPGSPTAPAALTGVPFVPAGLLAAWNAQAVNATSASGRFALGMNDGTTKHAESLFDQNGTASSVVHALASQTVDYIAGSGSAGTVIEQGAFTLTSDGFTLALTTQSATAWDIGYVLVGSAGGSPAPRSSIVLTA